ncbi:Bacteriophage peptidoglycan hydrolase [Lacticaseibacillus paracasei]|uniref:peptidoglycan amidohydrolase family protein n=1 Tax=Lacticaseibacillus paracasei TaxID=1597 RepID=UPI000FF4979D|nr:peptidoglycan amidohydrolase family protein [Lacticaseibacillus paracasei]RND66992.1 Bacteriophage peptidoglycan hydrolase [Lacticaseibacillus paracasei]
MSFDIDKTIVFLKSKIGHVTYSMYGSRNFSDGTCDCSGAVYTGLVQGGFAPMSYIPSTETLHAWLIGNGCQLIAENTEWQMQKGDIVIWGRKGYSAGAGGHTGICIDGHNWLECTAWRDLGETIQNHDARWAMNDQPYFYVYRYTGTTNSHPVSASNVSVSAPKVNVSYGLHLLGVRWLDEVTNFGSGDNGFAGMPNYQHDLLYIKVDHGSVKYRVHTVQSGWLPWVAKGDRSDTVNGCAGNAGEVIDGVQIIFLTPAGEPYKQAYYRSQTTQRAGWLGVVCDDGTSLPQYTDTYAGMFGEPLDRLQIGISSINPF